MMSEELQKLVVKWREDAEDKTIPHWNADCATTLIDLADELDAVLSREAIAEGGDTGTQHGATGAVELPKSASSGQASSAPAATICNRCRANLCEHDNCTDWTCARACSKCAPTPQTPATDTRYENMKLVAKQYEDQINEIQQICLDAGLEPESDAKTIVEAVRKLVEHGQKPASARPDAPFDAKRSDERKAECDRINAIFAAHAYQERGPERGVTDCRCGWIANLPAKFGTKARFEEWQRHVTVGIAIANLALREAAPSASGPEAALTEKEILNVLYHGRTMVNFHHVPSVTRAIDWLSQDFSIIFEERAKERAALRQAQGGEGK